MLREWRHFLTPYPHFRASAVRLGLLLSQLVHILVRYVSYISYKKSPIDLLPKLQRSKSVM